MLNNQFVYTITHNVGTQEVPEMKEFKGSFNVNKVIRSLEQNDDLIVILDDFNERAHKVPDIDIKTNKMVGYKNVRETVQSEIVLNKTDKERFFKLTTIE